MKSRKQFVDYFFWIAFILFTDLGGWQEALNIYEIGGGINFNDLLMPIMYLCYLIAKRDQVINDIYFNRIRFFLIIFLIYYFFGFSYLVPGYNNNYTTQFFTLIKIRHTFYSVLLFFFVYRFFQRSYLIFFKLFIYSSLIVLLLFLLSLLTGFIILPIKVLPREFMDVERKMLGHYGLLAVLIPLGISFILFGRKNKFKLYIYGSFILMNITWLLSLTRRHIIGSFIYFFIAYILLIYLKNLSISKKFRSISRTMLIMSVLIISIYLIFPAYLRIGSEIIDETVYVIEHGETTTGMIDERLSLNRPFIINIFYDNILFGTGFDNRWRTDIGDNEGYEASDYPFLSALAMVGVFGVMLFLPIYILIFEMLFKDLRFIRKVYLPDNNILFILFITTIIWLIYDLMKYMDWFQPISNPVGSIWYYMLGFYLAARKLVYSSYSNIVKNE